MRSYQPPALVEDANQETNNDNTNVEIVEYTVKAVVQRPVSVGKKEGVKLVLCKGPTIVMMVTCRQHAGKNVFTITSHNGHTVGVDVSFQNAMFLLQGAVTAGAKQWRLTTCSWNELIPAVEDKNVLDVVLPSNLRPQRNDTKDQTNTKEDDTNGLFDKITWLAAWPLGQIKNAEQQQQTMQQILTTLTYSCTS